MALTDIYSWQQPLSGKDAPASSCGSNGKAPACGAIPGDPSSCAATCGAAEPKKDAQTSCGAAEPKKDAPASCGAAEPKKDTSASCGAAEPEK